MEWETSPVCGAQTNPGQDVKPDPLQSERCARKLAALAAPERLRIVHFLRDGPRNVGEIADMLKTAAVNVSHHMHVLVEAGLVHREKRGRFVLYSLLPGVLETEGQQGAHDHLNLGCCRLELPPDDEQPAGGG
jgi:DNA-binding transcriptional ArsR family regulator